MTAPVRPAQREIMTSGSAAAIAKAFGNQPLFEQIDQCVATPYRTNQPIGEW
jgi:hypothetical protein